MQPLTVSGQPAALPSDDRIVVLGLGYVGLPLALSFVEAGLSVVGLDVNSSRVDELRSGRSPIDDVSDARLGTGLRRSLDVRGLDRGAVQSADAVIVCVPTPMDAARQPDLGPVLAAASFVRTGLRAGHLIVLQSTTYPGTTVGPFRSALESGLELRSGIDYDLAFAPERVSPGDPASAARDVPRLVGGVTAHSTSRAAALFGRINSRIVEVSSPDVAELAKLHENIFRNVNIALVNQLALLCERMGLDVWEVIDAAATKPFGFMPFRPGPGVGGHCIPVDPYYLAWRARQFGFVDRFVELAGDINMSMPRHVVDLVAEALNSRGQALNGSRVGVVGTAFKPDVRDPRNSPAAEVIAMLRGRSAAVDYHDPYIPRFTSADGVELHSQPLATLLDASDVIVALAHHRGVDWELVYEHAGLVVDTVGSSRGRVTRENQVLLLGAGWMPPAPPPHGASRIGRPKESTSTLP
jgi:UDP-N-acetyl-D-glucosamine dehydrogenase